MCYYITDLIAVHSWNTFEEEEEERNISIQQECIKMVKSDKSFYIITKALKKHVLFNFIFS